MFGPDSEIKTQKRGRKQKQDQSCTEIKVKDLREQDAWWPVTACIVTIIHGRLASAVSGMCPAISCVDLAWSHTPQKKPLSPTKPFQGWEAKTSKSLPSCHPHLFVGLLLHIPHECREIIKDASARKLRSQKPDMIDDRAWGNRQQLFQSTKKTQVPLKKVVQNSAENLPGWRGNVTSPAGHVVQVDRIPEGTALKNPMPQTTTPPSF